MSSSSVFPQDLVIKKELASKVDLISNADQKVEFLFNVLKTSKDGDEKWSAILFLSEIKSDKAVSIISSMAENAVQNPDYIIIPLVRCGKEGAPIIFQSLIKTTNPPLISSPYILQALVVILGPDGYYKMVENSSLKEPMKSCLLNAVGAASLEDINYYSKYLLK